MAAMLTYNILVTFHLIYLGIGRQLVGILLWPAPVRSNACASREAQRLTWRPPQVKLGGFTGVAITQGRP